MRLPDYFAVSFADDLVVVNFVGTFFVELVEIQSRSMKIEWAYRHL